MFMLETNAAESGRREAHSRAAAFAEDVMAEMDFC